MDTTQCEPQGVDKVFTPDDIAITEKKRKAKQINQKRKR